jgi:hypothetical protein
LYSHQIHNLYQFQSFFLPDFNKIGIKTNHIAESGWINNCELNKHTKRALQNIQCSEKLLKYPLKELKSSLEVLKRSQEYSKAFVKHSASLVFPIFQECSTLFFNMESTL